MFSDKTGTLTSNEMQLRQIAVRGRTYGSSKFRCCAANNALCRACRKILSLHSRATSMLFEFEPCWQAGRLHCLQALVV